MKNVLVFFGGVSCEHEVSVITGVMTANCLSGEANVYPVYIDTEGKWHTGEKLKDLSWYKTRDFSEVTPVSVFAGDNRLYAIKKNKIKEICRADAAINCTHGLNGEDGTLAGVMRLSRIAFASPGLFPSSAAMDKYFTKLTLKGIGVETLPYVKMNRINYVKKREFAAKYVSKRLSYPVIVKPANLGSSIGISMAKNGLTLNAALDNAFRYDDKVIVEKALTDFREINCACIKLGDKYLVSECEEPMTSGEILSEFSGAVRIAYLLDGEKIYVNEINSVPGSLAYYLFVDSIGEFRELLLRSIELAEEEESDRENNVYTYSSNVLSLDSEKLRK